MAVMVSPVPYCIGCTNSPMDWRAPMVTISTAAAQTIINQLEGWRLMVKIG